MFWHEVKRTADFTSCISMNAAGGEDYVHELKAENRTSGTSLGIEGLTIRTDGSTRTNLRTSENGVASALMLSIV